jgi:hypothetical protein
MSKNIINAGADAAAKILDSGHLVVAVFMLLTIILFGMVVWLLRENKRLNSLLSDLQEKTIIAFKNQEKQIELLLARLGNGG